MQQEKLSPLDRQFFQCLQKALSQSYIDQNIKGNVIRHNTDAIILAVKMYNQQYVSNLLGSIESDIDVIKNEEIKKKIQDSSKKTSQAASEALKLFETLTEKKSLIIKPNSVNLPKVKV